MNQKDSIADLAARLNGYVVKLEAAWEQGNETRVVGVREMIVVVLGKIEATRCEDAGVLEQVEATKARAAQIVQRVHRSLLEAGGHEYKGVRTGTRKEHRTTHCWKCQGPLSTHIDLECNACGWILCWCGACGCGFQPRRSW